MNWAANELHAALVRRRSRDDSFLTKTVEDSFTDMMRLATLSIFDADPGSDEHFRGKPRADCAISSCRSQDEEIMGHSAQLQAVRRRENRLSPRTFRVVRGLVLR